MNASLQGYAAAILGELDATQLGVVADELAALDAQMATNHDLSAALTDTSIPGSTRRAVLTELLGAKVAPATARLAGFAALVSQAQDVPSALSYLATRSRIAATGEPYAEPVLSVLGSRSRVGGFASALFEELDLGAIETMEDELFRFARTVEASGALRGLLADRDAPVDRRQAVVVELVGSRVTAPTERLLVYVIAGGRARSTVATIDYLVDQASRARGWRVAKVRTAQPLDEAQATSLKASLTHVAGNPVELQVTEDPSLVGGVRIEVGDLLVDASAKARLDALREHLEADHRTFLTND